MTSQSGGTWAVVASVLWRRLDTPGHDACRLESRHGRWRLSGGAVFRHEEGSPAVLTYRVETDAAWHTLMGRVEGWLGSRRIVLDVAREPRRSWRCNGIAVPDLDALVDLDLGFTPATNLLPLRRLQLREGDAADAPAAWLDVAAGTLTALPQRYARRSATEYWYESPAGDYAGPLDVAPTGFVRRYPGLWEMEA